MTDWMEHWVKNIVLIRFVSNCPSQSLYQMQSLPALFAPLNYSTRFSWQFKVLKNKVLAYYLVARRLWSQLHSFIHSFIHIEHFCSASSRKLLRSAPNTSTVTQSSLKVRKKHIPRTSSLVSGHFPPGHFPPDFSPG